MPPVDAIGPRQLRRGLGLAKPVQYSVSCAGRASRYGFAMSRVARSAVPGHPHHVAQRGAPRMAVFIEPGDRETYPGLLGKRRPSVATLREAPRGSQRAFRQASELVRQIDADPGAEAVYEGRFIVFSGHQAACGPGPEWGINPDAAFDCGNPKPGWLKKGVRAERRKREPGLA